MAEQGTRVTHPGTADADPLARIKRFLLAQDAGPSAHVTPLTPDASDRRYFRVHRPGNRNWVLALHPGSISFAEMPFADAQALFEAMPVPVPTVIGYSDNLGIIALDDLGDTTLHAHLRNATQAERLRRYAEAVRHITTIQRRGTALASTNCRPYRLAFDVEKFMLELRFFVEHFLQGWRHATPTDTDRNDLDAEFLLIATELAAEPRVMCHRDYHSRNLMLCRDRLFLIDYQDARLGPDTYDLASLLRDSYVDLPDVLVEALIDVYLGGQPRKLDSVARAAFVRRLDLMSVQRNLKALGTFGFQASQKENAAYVADIPRTLAYLRCNFEAYPRLARLHQTLAGYIEELA
jgi:aminoglycoside/choline kinase family phosphotransferase